VPNAEAELPVEFHIPRPVRLEIPSHTFALEMCDVAVHQSRTDTLTLERRRHPNRPKMDVWLLRIQAAPCGKPFAETGGRFPERFKEGSHRDLNLIGWRQARRRGGKVHVTSYRATHERHKRGPFEHMLQGDFEKSLTLVEPLFPKGGDKERVGHESVCEDRHDRVQLIGHVFRDDERRLSLLLHDDILSFRCLNVKQYFYLNYHRVNAEK